MTINNPMNVQDVKGIEPVLTLAGTDKEKVQQLIDLLEENASTTQKGHLDMIARPALIQLLVELDAIWASVT